MFTPLSLIKRIHVVFIQEISGIRLKQIALEFQVSIKVGVK